MAEITGLTYETVLAWSPEEMRKQLKDPAVFAQVNEVLRQKNEQDETERATQAKAIEDAEQQRLARRLAVEEQEAADELARQEESKRWASLSRDERIAELAARKKKEDQEERERYLAQVAREKEQARLDRMRPEEIEAEKLAKEAAEERAEAERLAAEQADAEAKAAADKEATDKAAADAALAEAEKKAADEKARLVAEAAAAPKQKIVREYQVKDENGNPIGRPTHLEADTWEEMALKLQAAHENAMRFAERLKKRQSIKPEFNQPVQKVELLSEEQLVQLQKDLDSNNDLAVAKAKAALELNEARKTYVKNFTLAEEQKAQNVSFEFMKLHPEYNPCLANSQILGDYIQKENLAWTVSNLEIAYAATESQMAPRIQDNPQDTTAIDSEVEVARQAEEARVAEAAKAAQEAEEARLAALIEAAVQKRLEREKAAITTPPASVAAATPVATSTPIENTSAAPNAPAAVRKPSVAGGIEPGSLHGSRSVGTTTPTKPVGYTKQDIVKMSRDEYKKRMRDPKFVAKVNELFGKK